MKKIFIKLINLISQLSNFLPFSYLTILSLLIASIVAFINKEISLVHNTTFPKLLQVRKCLNNFNLIKEGFSETFFLILGASQLLGTFCIFTAIARFFHWTGIFVFLYYLFIFLGLMIHTLGLVNSYDNMHKIKVLDRMYIENENLREEKHLKVLKGEILQIGPITAMGFFSIDRSILTAMGSFTATYIVILLQFRIGEN